MDRTSAGSIAAAAEEVRSIRLRAGYAGTSRPAPTSGLSQATGRQPNGYVRPHDNRIWCPRGGMQGCAGRFGSHPRGSRVVVGLRRGPPGLRTVVLARLG